MESTGGGSKFGVALRVGVYVFLSFTGMVIFSNVLLPLGGYLVAAALSVFAAAAIANAITLRIYERGLLADIGFHWNRASRRNLLLGLAGGAGAAGLMLGMPLLAGLAELRPDPEYPASLASFAFVSVVLLFGATGEELLFRGYGFQVLLKALGPYATILPAGVLFGFAHSANQNAGQLGLINTAAWGVLLGLAVYRSGDLWLAIGLHFGWNWMLPVFGVNLSGFTMKITGYAMHWKVGELWSGGAYGPEGGLFTSAAVLLVGYFLWKAPILRQPAYLWQSSEEE